MAGAAKLDAFADADAGGGGMIYFAVDEPRRHLLEHYVARGWGAPLESRIRQVTYPQLFREKKIERGAWIFTGLEALSPAELRLVDRIQSAARDSGLSVHNSALNVVNRYGLLQLLRESGINDFRAHRADGPLDDVRFPVFVRVANEHDGSLTPLLYDHRQLSRAMIYIRMRGLPREHLLVIEFCDTAGSDGLFRKYSIFRIGDRYIPRYLHIGSHWMTKEGTRTSEEALIQEQMVYLLENPHAGWVRQVFEMARIEYGRLDYGVHDGRPQAWEINLAPTLSGDPRREGGGPTAVANPLFPARAHAHMVMREAFEQLDPGPIDGDDVRFDFPPSLVEEARRERRALEAILARRRRIGKIAAFPGLAKVGPLLRRRLSGDLSIG
ncbi:MAG: hypothetical protein LAO79_08070 [Acidobacteriia bacterium]|nr:hypothetical protein [Terriglobia bacterium]